jgi:long-chain acyl-CoA synthetase
VSSVADCCNLSNSLFLLVLLASISLGDYEWVSYGDFFRRYMAFGSGLRTFLAPRSYVGLLSVNRCEWLIADFACLSHSFVSIPLHTTYTFEAQQFIINTTELVALIVSLEQVTQSRAHVQQLIATCPSIRHIVLMRDGAMEPEGAVHSACEGLRKAAGARTSGGVSIHLWDEVEKLGHVYRFAPVHTKPDEITTV